MQAMPTPEDLVAWCDALLEPARFDDYCPNGLQVEGRRPLKRLVSGVTASLALIERAAELEADAILVHHGWFWRGENPCLTGMKGRRVRALIDAGIALVAYHLPLDAHPEVGNNAQLGALLEFADAAPIDERGLLWSGTVGTPLAAGAVALRIRERLGREPLVVTGGDRPIRRIAWCTGAAQGYIERAVSAGVDAYLTGEVSEQTVHVARECGIHFFAAGHHATERGGVRALGARAAAALGIEHEFVDLDNPA